MKEKETERILKNFFHCTEGYRCQQCRETGIVQGYSTAGACGQATDELCDLCVGTKYIFDFTVDNVCTAQKVVTEIWVKIHVSRHDPDFPGTKYDHSVSSFFHFVSYKRKGEAEGEKEKYIINEEEEEMFEKIFSLIKEKVCAQR